MGQTRSHRTQVRTNNCRVGIENADRFHLDLVPLRRRREEMNIGIEGDL
jgi:hypothetical protein